MKGPKIIAVFLALSLAGCSPRIVEKVRTEYVYRDRVERDTTVLHDSTYIREYIKGDTVRFTEYRDRYLYRDRWRERTDTLAVHDTTEVVKEVEKPLNGWQRFRLGAFWWLVAGIAGCIVWIFRKQIFNIVKL